MSTQATERPREAELPGQGSADVRLDSVRTSFGDVVGDDRGEVCKDYSEWTQAWTEIKG